MTEKVIGYLLLVSGLLIIFLSASSVYSVFTGIDQPVQLFSSSGIMMDLESMLGQDLALEQKQQLEQSGMSLQTQLVEPDLINRPFNLGAHLIFMGFMVTVGFRISLLGVNLVRPIKVKLRQESEPKPTSQKPAA